VQGKASSTPSRSRKGEAEFIRAGALVRRYGAAVIVMAFDEQGQADTLARKVEICERAYLLTKRSASRPRTSSSTRTSSRSRRASRSTTNYALDFIEATR
jgi:5-methyltetrahydrofolate--homocysteine methyltransferase